MKLVSWNLLRRHGASARDVAALLRAEQPDALFMQEATHDIARVVDLAGGYFTRAPMPGRIHGVAVWTAVPLAAAPVVLPLPSHFIERVCLIVDLGPFQAANVHLSHGQWLNRRQLRRIAAELSPRAAILGDFNLVGPTLLADFHDVGPRHATHLMGEYLPLRLDRCLARGLVCTQAQVLDRQASDHRPIVVRLKPIRGEA